INTRRIIFRLGSYALPYKRLSIALVMITLFATTIELIPPYFTKIIIDDVFSPVLQGASIQSRLRLLSLLVGAFAAIRVTSAGLAVLRGRLAVSLGAAITRDIRVQLYECLQRLSLSFYDKRQVGSVMSRVTQDSNHLSGFLVEGVQYYVVNLLLVIGIPIVLLGINWKLGVLVLIPTPVVVLATVASWKRLMKKFHHLWHTWGKLSAVLNDALSGIKVVKAFGQEEIEIMRFSTRNEHLYDAGVKAEQTVQLVFPTLGFIMSIGSLLVWWYGGRQVLFGDAKLGDLMAFLAYIGMFYAPVQILTRISEWMSRSLTAAERIFEVMDTVPEIADAPDSIPMPNIKGDVEFRNVDFGYDKHKPVLKDISFHVKAGEMIGLVGHSGAGKSTTINLICRFYDPTGGVILLDGVDMRKVKLADLRRQIGVVLQDPFLFNGTIAENIAYGKPDASREEIIAAAKAANAHEFIMRFPDGYDTYVRERGGRLSGGERQRIAIARAILRDPKILILDEATSSVDTETEKQLQEAIARLVKGRTTFAIAHTLSTLRNADRLLVLENGKFVEYGTHEELLAKKGVYYKLVQLQKAISKIKAVDG
ncbi:MAG: ABC transporter ATP-binding protein, partial [Armatimonadota bacterium]